MIRFKDKEFKQWSICPATGDIFDSKTGEVQKTYVNKGRLIFRRMPVHCIMTHTFYGYKPGYDIHHLDENKLNNSLSNLVYLTHAEHSSLHKKGKKRSDEAKAKIAAAKKGKPTSDEARAKIAASMKGKKRSKETRAKLSAANKGNVFWNKDGVIIRAIEWPGEGWKKGRLKTGA